jgi:Ca-activated chloride channel family protein
MTAAPLVAAIAMLALVAQDPRPVASAPSQQPVFTSEAELVVMNVVVRNRDGVAVDGLSRDAFRIYEQGVPRPVDLFARPEEPITLGLVIDASGSMMGNRARLVYAASRFADAGRPDDEIFAVAVGDRVTPVLPVERPFTSSPEVLRAALWDRLGSLGRTSLWDGVVAGLEYLERGSHARRALVVISDGEDNASAATFAEALQKVRASSATVYALGLVDPILVAGRPRSLKELARASGGEAFFPKSHQAALEALTDIGRQIHSGYTLGFAPPAVTRDGGYHRLTVTAQAPDGGRLDVRTRAGYLTAGPRTPTPRD